MTKLILSTSVFGDNPRYVVGIHRQYELAKYYFPNWEFRVYVDDRSKINIDATIIEIKDGSYGAFWRFLPLFEAADNIVVVRDADSRITPREAMAIYQWIQSGIRFHIIRDHPLHFRKPILAGLFALRGKLDQSFHDAMLPYMTGAHSYGTDEEYLETVIYPHIRNDCLVHEINKGWFGLSKKFLKNPFEYCGNAFDQHDMPIYPVTDNPDDYPLRNLPTTARFASYPYPWEDR